MKFFKMHAQGNDYVYFDWRSGAPACDFGHMARVVSNRHTGVGGDGMVAITTTEAPGADAGFRMWNADGSEAEICGSALRCVTKYLGVKPGVEHVVLHTTVGLRRGELTARGVRVDMGEPGEPRPMRIEGLDCWFVNMGNPHLVLFSGHPNAHELRVIGPKLEHSLAHGVNVHMAHVLDHGELTMLTWERGTGMTLACGSGACAVVQAATKQGVRETSVALHQAGGDVRVTRDADTGHLWLEGEVNFVCEGTLDDSLVQMIMKGNS